MWSFQSLEQKPSQRQLPPITGGCKLPLVTGETGIFPFLPNARLVGGPAGQPTPNPKVLNRVEWWENFFKFFVPFCALAKKEVRRTVQ